MNLSSSAASLEPSGIREIMSLAHDIPSVIHLEVGEPDTPTPAHILQAADRAARDGKTKYAPNPGIPELREQIAYHSRRRGIAIDADQVIVTNGATQGIFLAITSLLDPGAEILIPEPGWPNYTMMATLVRAIPVPYPLHAENAYTPRIEEIVSRISPRTRMLVLNSPSNPLGTIIDPPAMRELLEFADARRIWVLVDECYEEILYDDSFMNARAIVSAPALITAHSFSKTYAMTGLRVGYVTAPRHIISAFARVQEALVSSVNTPAQYAALAALQGPSGSVREMVELYRRRRDAAMGVLRQSDPLALCPAGAFYVWVDISRSGMPSIDFARKLLGREGVAVAPGAAFGASGDAFIRVTLAAPEKELNDAFNRIMNAASPPGDQYPQS